MAHKIYTLHDARNEKRMMDADLFAKMDAREAEAARIAELLKNNPQVGVLNGGKFYTMEGGEYRESRQIEDLI